MAEDVYISGLGPGVPEWSNEATQQLVLNALNSGFSSNVDINRQIMQALSGLSRNEDESSNKLSTLVTGLKKNEDAIKKGNATNESNVAANKKQNGFLASLSSILSDTNRTTKKQLDITKRIAEYEKQGLTNAEANLRANMDSAKASKDTMVDDLKDYMKEVVATATFVTAANSKTITGVTSRSNMAQEMRQSGLLAGMDSTGAGLINLSKTISRSNFTFGEAEKFTRQFSQAVGVRGVKASMEFANTLAKSGDGNSDMMQRFGMEFSEVTAIAGSYMESLRSIGQLDKLSDNQMRLGMDNFMDTVVSTSNVMKINLQDAANMIADTLKQDQYASQLALMDPEMRENVEAMVGRFGGEGTQFGTGLATAIAAGSTQDFLQTDVAQNLQGDVIGQKLLPIITQLADTARTQGPEAVNALYATMGPQFDAILQFARDNKALINLNEGNARTLVTELAGMRQTVKDADKGAVPLSGEDKALNSLIESQRLATVVSEANETLVLQEADLSKSLNNLVGSSLILTRELAILGAETSTLRGNLREIALGFGTAANMTLAGAAQVGTKNTPEAAGIAPENAMDFSHIVGLEHLVEINNNSVGTTGPSEREQRNLELITNSQKITSLEGDIEAQAAELAKQFREAEDPERLARRYIEQFESLKRDDTILPGNRFNTDATQANNADMNKLIRAVQDLVNQLN